MRAVPDPVAVALLGDARTAAGLAQRLGWQVAATSEDDHLAVTAGLEADLVVGLAAVPWPTAEEVHAQGSADLPAYTGVVSWHGLPSLHDRLAEAASPGVRGGAHLLVTAPDPGPVALPTEVTFLREVAEALTARLDPPSRSIAWRGDTRTPTAVDAVTSLVEAHGRADVIECPVAPGMSADPAVTARAQALGIRLTCIDLGAATRLDLLAEVVRTVAGHEGVA